MGKSPEAWSVPYHHFLGRGVPRGLLDKGCVADYEAERIINALARTPGKLILEVGTFIGLSTSVLALASPHDAKIISVDPNFPFHLQGSEFGSDQNIGCTTFARNALSAAGVASKVTFIEGYFSSVPDADHSRRLRTAGLDPRTRTVVGDTALAYGPFDFVFLDGDHAAQAVYSDLTLISRGVTEDVCVVMHDMLYGAGLGVRTGLYRFLSENPDYLLTMNENLGFLRRYA